MKLTRDRLKQIIKEELNHILSEEDLDEAGFLNNIAGKVKGFFGGKKEPAQPAQPAQSTTQPSPSVAKPAQSTQSLSKETAESVRTRVFQAALQKYKDKPNKVALASAEAKQAVEDAIKSGKIERPVTTTPSSKPPPPPPSKTSLPAAQQTSAGAVPEVSTLPDQQLLDLYAKSPQTPVQVGGQLSTVGGFIKSTRPDLMRAAIMRRQEIQKQAKVPPVSVAETKKRK